MIIGKTIVYFSQFLQALYQLGAVGIGKAHARYEIVFIRNTVGKDILDGYEVRMERYEVRTLWEYVDDRKKEGHVRENRIRFKTPVTLKYQGRMQTMLSLEAVVPALLRRIYMLDCFEGVECGKMNWGGPYPKTFGKNTSFGFGRYRVL